MISAGTLALGGSGSITSPNILIGGGAKFDVSGLSSPFTLNRGQTLGNSSSTALLKGSASTGTGTLALNYSSGSPSLMVANGTLIVSTGTVFQISNLGSQLAVGNYKLIAKSGGGTIGGTVTTNPVPVGGGGAAASATLAIANGELNLVVGNPVNTTPTNITVTVSSNTLNLSWPADHTGWRLLAQTNNLNRGVSDNTNDWGTYAGGYTTTNAVSIHIAKTNSNEYYRMVYP